MDAKPSHEQIIISDRARVDSLQNRLSTASNIAAGRGGLRAVSIPAHTGDFVRSGNYIVNVGIGTPKQDFSVEFDTGSDLSWIQCKPCNRCYPQNDPLFDPAKSSTYSSICCGSAECAAQPNPPSCSGDRACRYQVDYADKSRSSGNFSRNTLTLSPRDQLPNFRFGCGDHNRWFFGQAAGLIGLGRGASSLISQASQKYGAIFSYCLPSIASSTGYLSVGSTGRAPAGIRYTPMIREASDSSLYYVKLVAIKVGGKKLDIKQKVFSKARTLMDSGTVITRLPPAAYSAMRAVFRRHMVNYTAAPAFQILDTCYNLGGHEEVKVRAVELVFDGGASLNLDLDGIMMADPSQACLAFAGNSNDQQLSIIGNTQQMKFTMVYDISNQRIGFGAKGCS
ncbi:Protein ASPARTIC PROTEASE IN GUARD CELL 2 [Ananas comosus]|uniref:Protein ASPARTIC PROTEASE IN GUARD CELL 2 n=1 Tax=Ananas comosus TaxID=4615 RepID=A0A199UG01_ANACO|nr:Protein ASPARTIC PROTEASE IN GUARD CELL 2 [Ananas comosus]